LAAALLGNIEAMFRCNTDRTIIRFFASVVAICARRIDQHMINATLSQNLSHHAFRKRRTADIACTDK